MASGWPLDSALVILVCTLSGGFDRADVMASIFPSANIFPPLPSSCNKNFTGNNGKSSGAPTCQGSSVRWRECPPLDSTVHPLHLLSPWLLSFCTLVFLSMPTVLLRSRAKEKGLGLFAGHLFQFLGLLVCCAFLSDHAGVCYTFSIHASIRFLARIEFSSALVGGRCWWGMRYVAVLLILLCQFLFGPPVSVVHWQPATPQFSSELTPPTLCCAYLCHLVGCIAPDLCLSFVQGLISSAQYIHIRGD